MTDNRKKSSSGKEDNTPNAVDSYVGNRIRLRRLSLGLSQDRLGEMIGLSFQQIQKYEWGKNRISASRLWDLSQILNVSPDFFYEGMDSKTMQQSPRFKNTNQRLIMEKEENYLKEIDPLHKSETIKLVTAFNRISNRKAANYLLKIIETMAKSVPGENHTEKDD